MKKFFEATVRGTYHAISDITGTPIVKQYEEKFVLPSQEAALSNVCKFLLAPRLKKVHKDFIRFRTHELVGIKLVGHTPDPEVLQMAVEDMSMPQLFDFCVLRQLTIDPYQHPKKTIDQIREMVLKAYREKQQMKKDSEKTKGIEDRAKADALLAMNDLEVPKEGIEINVNEQKATAAMNKKEPTMYTGTKAAPGPEADEPLPAPVDDSGLE